MIYRLYTFYKLIYLKIYLNYSNLRCKLLFRLNKVVYKKITSIGVPLLDIHPKGSCTFEDSLIMVNNAKFATLGRNNRCKIVVSEHGKLSVGNKVGMSNATIVATCSVTIGNNVMIGGGVTIVDSDFHSLNPHHWFTDDDLRYMKKSPVVIGNDVFIGMDSIIIKGVTVGNDVIIAAGSVVITNIPDNEVWGGNPAKYIKTKK